MEENQSQEKVAVIPGLTFEGPMNELYGALAKAQMAFGPILKTREVKVTPRNSPPYTFKYAPLDEVIEKTRSALNANGLCLLQPFSYDSDNVPVIRTVLAHESGAKITCEFPLQANKREFNEQAKEWRERPLTMQELGSQMTYARRYSYGCLTGVTSEEDDDGNAGDGNDREVKDRAPTSRATPPPMPSTTKPAAVQPKPATPPAAAKPETKPAPAATPAGKPETKAPPAETPVSTGTPIVKVGDGSVVAPAAKPDPAQNDQRPPAGLEQSPSDLSQATHGNALAPTEPPLADPADVVSDDGVVYPTWAEPADKTPATDSSRKNLGATARELRFTRSLLDELCKSTIGIPAGLMTFEADFKKVQAAIEKAGKRA